MSVFVEDLPDESIPWKKRKKYHTKYNEKYSKEYSWVQPSKKGEFFAFCFVCKVDISIKAVGAKGLRDHEATCRHSQRSREVLGFYAPSSYSAINNIPLHPQTTHIMVVQNVSYGMEQNVSKVGPNTGESGDTCQMNDISGNNNQMIISGAVQQDSDLLSSHVSALTSTSYPTLEVVNEGMESPTHIISDPLTPNTPSSPLNHDHFDQKLNMSSTHVQDLNHHATVELNSNHLSNSMEYSSETSVQNHVMTNGEQVNSCTTSDSQLEFKPDYKHEQTNENIDDDLSCNVCDKVFGHWKDLKSHLLQHIQEVKQMRENKTPDRKPTIKKRGRLRPKQEPNDAFDQSEPDNPESYSQTVILKPSSSTVIKQSPSSKSVIKRKRGRPKKNRTRMSPNKDVNSKILKILDSPADDEEELDDPLKVTDLPDASVDKIWKKEFSKVNGSKRSGHPQCRFCQAIFIEKSELDNHYILEHNNGKPYWCESCDRYFSTMNNLEVHKKHKHADGPDPLTCVICNKVLTSRSNLKVHMQVHSGEKPYECPLCNTKFKRKGNMEMHMVCHTGERQFICEVCGQSFSAMKTLRRHRKLHTGERDFKCDICSCSYITASDLRRHMFKHLSVKPFACSLCGKQFTRAYDLNVHMRYHYKEVRFKCSVCGKDFVESGNYHRHMRKHTGERPYSCSFCNSTFTQVHHFKEHVRKCHGNEPESLAKYNTANGHKVYKTSSNKPRTRSLRKSNSNTNTSNCDTKIPTNVTLSQNPSTSNSREPSSVPTDIPVSVMSVTPINDINQIQPSSFNSSTTINSNTSSQIHQLPIAITNVHSTQSPHTAILGLPSQSAPSQQNQVPQATQQTGSQSNIIQYNYYINNGNSLSPYHSLFDMCNQE